MSPEVCRSADSVEADSASETPVCEPPAKFTDLELVLLIME